MADTKLLSRHIIGMLVELLGLILLGCLTVFCMKTVNFGLIAIPLEETLGSLTEVASKSSRLVIGFILIMCGPFNLSGSGLLSITLEKSR